MNLRTRFALAFAAVAAAVAGLVGILSYNAAADRITNELARTLQTATTALISGQDGVLSVPATVAEPDRSHRDRFGEERQLVAQAISPAGTPTRVGGRDVTLPIDDAARALAASSQAGGTAIDEVEAADDTFRPSPRHPGDLISVRTLPLTTRTADAPPTYGAVVVTAAGAVSRVRLTQGRELVTLGHLWLAEPGPGCAQREPGIGHVVRRGRPPRDLPQVNATATTILRAFAALPGNADREDLRRRRAGRVVF